MAAVVLVRRVALAVQADVVAEVRLALRVQRALLVQRRLALRELLVRRLRGPAGGGGRGGGMPNQFGFSTWLLKDGEDKYIANRLVEIFNEAGIKKMSTKTMAVKKS